MTCPPSREQTLEAELAEVRAENTCYREALEAIAERDMPHYRDGVYMPQAVARAALEGGQDVE